LRVAQLQIDGRLAPGRQIPEGPGPTDSRRLREDESVEKYADRKGLVITNTARPVYPNKKKKNDRGEWK
jgi:hypothetical protein